MVELSASGFLTECQTTLSKDPANYVTDSSGKSVLKPELSTDICSIFCLRHGTCVRGKCHCHHGYAGDNCHLVAGKGPQLARIRSNNTCDVSSRPCRKVFMDVTNIENKPSLACKVHVLQEDGSEAPGGHSQEAEFLSAGRLACSLPDTEGKAMTRFSISATNDGHLYGNSLHVTVYDATCLSCDQNGACALLTVTSILMTTC
ncbi:uncharacterized protein LOC143288731 [Babylonia areolata]|uniref:uncharacterized protein LOC143288731 n=1 Tax=Babylonia areolata TaxID=304850 RepID=UPI003FD6B651